MSTVTTTKPRRIPAALVPPAGVRPADFYRTCLQAPTTASELYRCAEADTAGVVLYHEQMSADGIPAFKKAMREAMKAANPLPDPEATSEEQQNKLLKQGYAIPLSPTLTAIASPGGVAVYYGAVGELVELPDLATAKALAGKIGKPLPYTLGRDRSATLTPDALSKLAAAIQAVSESM